MVEQLAAKSRPVERWESSGRDAALQEGTGRIEDLQRRIDSAQVSLHRLWAAFHVLLAF